MIQEYQIQEANSRNKKPVIRIISLESYIVSFSPNIKNNGISCVTTCAQMSAEMKLKSRRDYSRGVTSGAHCNLTLFFIETKDSRE